jgi:hypothetical protein
MATNFRVVVLMAHNVLWLCVCLPLAQGFNLTTNLMGQIAQNRCYLLGGLSVATKKKKTK